MNECQIKGHRFRPPNLDTCSRCGCSDDDVAQFIADEPILSHRDQAGDAPIAELPEVRRITIAAGDPGQSVAFYRRRNGSVIMRLRVRGETVARFGVTPEAAAMLRIFMTVTDPDFIPPRSRR